MNLSLAAALVSIITPMGRKRERKVNEIGNEIVSTSGFRGEMAKQGKRAKPRQETKAPDFVNSRFHSDQP
jgi:hypothetical protein